VKKTISLKVLAVVVSLVFLLPFSSSYSQAKAAVFPVSEYGGTHTAKNIGDTYGDLINTIGPFSLSNNVQFECGRNEIHFQSIVGSDSSMWAAADQFSAKGYFIQADTEYGAAWIDIAPWGNMNLQEGGIWQCS
jgi:hypothetical protein